ncbi:MAG: dephospho-CoA kinase [Candidatus Rokubacteria bacterium]|nr:dephospho-CoA kinase [Candidatus Rokubacteria bacterium]
MRVFLLVGLTGGIATGKSTVSEMFRRHGCVVIDADVLAREVVEPGEPALAQIVEAFGRDVLQPDGRLDRKKVGAMVFGDAAKRKRLEEITHPAIRERFARRVAELTAERFRGIALFDAPVIIESGNDKTMDRLVVVAANEETQLARLMARDGIDREAGMQRIRSQMPIAEKVKLADYVIWNDGELTQTDEQVTRVHAALNAELELGHRLTVPPSPGSRSATSQGPEAVAERLRLALELHGVGEAMMRQTLRREHPDADDAEIEARILAWLQERPGAEFGDSVGRPAPWPLTGP